VNKVVDDKDDPGLVYSETISLAERILSNSSEVLALGKEAYYKQISIPNVDEAFEFGTRIMIDNL